MIRPGSPALRDCLQLNSCEQCDLYRVETIATLQSDAADAPAICDAAGRPGQRFVPVRSDCGYRGLGGNPTVRAPHVRVHSHESYLLSVSNLSCPQPERQAQPSGAGQGAIVGFGQVAAIAALVTIEIQRGRDRG